MKTKLFLIPGKLTIESLFCLRQQVENYREKKKKLCMVFIDLEKVYDRMPREVLKWTLMKKVIPNMYVTEHMYEDSCIYVKSMYEE